MKKAVTALLITFSTVRILTGDSAGPIGILVFAGCLAALYLAEGRLERTRYFYPWAAFFSVSAVWANAEPVFYGETHKLYRLIVLLYCLAGAFLLANEMLEWLWYWYLHGGRRSPDTAAEKKTQRAPVMGKHFFAICFLICLASFLSGLLLNFPGIMYNDGIDQYEQAAGLAPYSNHQPWVHTLLLKGCMAFGGLFSKNVYSGLLCYTVLQMILLALIFAYVLETADRAGTPKPVLIAGLLVMAFIPYNPLNSLVIGKDTLFAACVMLLSCCGFRILGERVESGRTDFVLYGLSSVCMCLFRSNGWYAYLALSAVLVFLPGKKERRVLFVNLGVILFALLVRGPVMNAFDVTAPDTAESLSLPLQQIARVYAEGGNVDAKSAEYLEHIMNTEYMAEYYDPEISDGIKWLLRFGDQEYLRENFGGFLGVWIRLGIKNPGIYLDAFREQTCGYWYPYVERNGYAFYGIAPNEDGLSGVHPIACNFTYALFDLVFSLQKIIPGYALFWSAGGTMWAILVMLAFSIRDKKRELTAAILPHIFVWMTLLIATPVNGDFRYAYCWIMSFPFLVMLFLGYGRRKA